MPGPLPGMTVSIDDSHVLEKHIAAGVYRGDMRCEAGMVALYHNAGTQMLEYEACKGGVAIPYSLHTNPINIGYPDSLASARLSLATATPTWSMRWPRPTAR